MTKIADRLISSACFGGFGGETIWDCSLSRLDHVVDRWNDRAFSGRITRLPASTEAITGYVEHDIVMSAERSAMVTTNEAQSLQLRTTSKGNIDKVVNHASVNA